MSEKNPQVGLLIGPSGPEGARDRFHKRRPNPILHDEEVEGFSNGFPPVDKR
jgi:hypothetical protein